MVAKRDTIYSYYKVNVQNEKFDHGYVCIRIQRPPLIERLQKQYQYTFTYSFCSPKDNFSKRIARRIADGRFASGGPMYIHNSLVKLSIDQLTEHAFEVLDTVPSLPSWYKKEECSPRVLPGAYLRSLRNQDKDPTGSPGNVH